MQHLNVPHALESAGMLRREVLRCLADKGVSEDIRDDVALVLTELVSNAVRHGSPLPDGTLRAGWRVGRRTVHLEVADGGRGPNRTARLPHADDTCGRGLFLVEVLSHHWGVRAEGKGSAVWAELSLKGAPVPA